MPPHPSQQAGLEFDDFRRAFNTLPAEQREALVLVGADGFRYEEAAAICGCPIGTIKSRVARARGEIERLLGVGGRETAAQAIWPAGRAECHGAARREQADDGNDARAKRASRTSPPDPASSAGSVPDAR